MIKIKLLLLFLFSIFVSIGFAQTDIRPYIEKGNKFYEAKQYKSAAVTFKHACILDSLSVDAWYNFGNALYSLDKFILAASAYERSLELNKDNYFNSNILHNLGNCYLQQKLYAKAIDFYKKSLLINSSDNDTRYNLAFAQVMLDKEKEAKKSNKKKDKPKDKPKEEPKPSAFALECKNKADALVLQYKYKEAYMIMSEGVKKDNSVQIYQEYTKKLQDVSKLIEGGM